MMFPMFVLEMGSARLKIIAHAKMRIILHLIALQQLVLGFSKTTAMFVRELGHVILTTLAIAKKVSWIFVFFFQENIVQTLNFHDQVGAEKNVKKKKLNNS